MDHAKKMPGGTGSMMSRRKTLGSMMNPQPVQFAMGAKMYTHGGSHSGMAFRSTGGRAPAGISTEGYSKEELAQLAQMKEAFKKAGGMNTPEGRKIAAKARALQDKISLAEVYERYADEFAEVPNIPEDVERQMPSNVPGVLPIGQRQMPSNVPGAPPTKDMMRKLKEYLKGGKSEAGLKALAASNPNLTYKEAVNGMRLIKDPVGMKSAGEGRKMYRHGGAHDSSGPILNPFDDSEMAQVQRRERERSMMDQGLLSKPGEGVTLAFGEGSPVDFQTVQKRFRENNPDLFDPSKDYELLDGERVFFTRGVNDPDDPEGFFQRIVMPSDTRGLKRESTDTYTDILRGLMSEFDNYVASFGDEVKNNPEAIQKAREKFKKEARNVAEQMEERRFG